MKGLESGSPQLFRWDWGGETEADIGGEEKMRESVEVALIFMGSVHCTTRTLFRSHGVSRPKLEPHLEL